MSPLPVCVLSLLPQGAPEGPGAQQQLRKCRACGGAAVFSCHSREQPGQTRPGQSHWLNKPRAQALSWGWFSAQAQLWIQRRLTAVIIMDWEKGSAVTKHCYIHCNFTCDIHLLNKNVSQIISATRFASFIIWGKGCNLDLKYIFAFVVLH